MTKNYQVETACLEDLPLFSAIESEVHGNPWSSSMLKDSLLGNHLCFKLISQKKLCGYMIIMQVEDQLELLNIAISPLMQRKGLGSLLLENLLNYANQNQIESVFLEVRCTNLSAIALYRKFNFNQVGIRKNYYFIDNQSEDALIMAWHR